MFIQVDRIVMHSVTSENHNSLPIHDNIPLRLQCNFSKEFFEEHDLS